jgi:hypothetical protein
MIRPPLPLSQVSKALRPCSASVCTPSMAFTDMVGLWQDHACIPSATHYDTAMLPIAADNDLAHLQMLREVKHCVSNEDDVPPHPAGGSGSVHLPGPQSQLLDRTVHCCAQHLCGHPCPAQQQDPPRSFPCSGWPAGCRLVWIHNCSSRHHSISSLLLVKPC